jgi:uncharacterized damage-inducible protein DinB
LQAGGGCQAGLAGGMIRTMSDAIDQTKPAKNALLLLFQHKTWATLRLIEHCRSLDEEQRNATFPGAFGSIRSTLHHLVSSDEGYYATLTGERRSEKLTDAPVPLEELAERLRRLGPHWEALAQDPAIHTRAITTRDGWRTIGAILIAQAIHHADEHRSHVLSSIGARGLELPGLDIGEDLDIWHYGIATGLMQEIATGVSS